MPWLVFDEFSFCQSSKVRNPISGVVWVSLFDKKLLGSQTEVFCPSLGQLGALCNHQGRHFRNKLFFSGRKFAALSSSLSLETPKRKEKVSFSVNAVPLDSNFRVILRGLVTDGQQQLRASWFQPLSLHPTFVFREGMRHEVRKVELPLSREIPKDLAVSDRSRAPVLTRITLRTLWLWPASDLGWQCLFVSLVSLEPQRAQKSWTKAEPTLSSRHKNM